MNYAVITIFFSLVQYCIVEGGISENPKYQSFRIRIHKAEIVALPKRNVVLFPDIILAQLSVMKPWSSPDHPTIEACATLELDECNRFDKKLLSDELTVYYQNVSLFADPRIKPDRLSHPELIDLTNKDAPNIINKWIFDKSGKKIEKFYREPFDPRLGALVVGAGHFESFWKYPFPQTKTKEGIFYNGKSEIRVPFMENKENVLYYSNGYFQSIGIPCTEGNHLFFILPPKGSPLSTFSSFLPLETYVDVLRYSEPARIRYKVPKFSLKYRSSLKNALQILGMVRSFMPQAADFSLLTDSRIHIDDVTYESVLNVFESRINAAGVVSTEMVISNLTNPSEHLLLERDVHYDTKVSEDTPPPEIIINRPFLFVLYDKFFNLSLLSGAVYSPQ